MSKSARRPVRTQRAPTTVLDTEPALSRGQARRRYLTEDEVERIIKVSGNERDRLMILMGYRHGLRVSELINMTWRQIDLNTHRLEVRRAKGGEDGQHPIGGREIRGLRKLRRQQPAGARYVFVTARTGAPMTRNGFYKLLAKAAAAAGLDGVHPHLLRHGCGFRLVNQGIDTLSLAAYLGHANIHNTKRYARMNASRFDGIWRD